MSLMKRFLAACSFLLVTAFFACGGGGGGGTPPIPATAPTISTQPASQTVASGATATFTVTAAGTAPLSYQWNRNSAAITGAISASYTTAATTSADSGASFTVTVTNSAGAITSSAAVLTVQTTAPAITTQPASQSVLVGASATFTVVATGSAPLSYQWKKGGSNIANAISASYTTPVTALSDSGSSFTVTVTNAASSVTSSAAILTVQTTATALAYTDPTTGTYLLKRSAASTPTHLVLDLYGPTTGTAAGVSITLTADTTKVTWVDVSAGGTTAALLANGTQFILGSGTPILKAKATAGVLQATVAQKPPTAAAALNGKLLSVALDLKAGLGLPQGTVISLSAGDTTKCQVLDASGGSGSITGIAVAVGTLTAQ